MMRPSRRVGVVGFAAGGLLILLFLQAQGIDVKRNSLILEQLRQLKQLDTTLTEHILKLRFGLLLFYDPVTQTLTELKESTHRLKSGPLAIYAKGHAALDRAFEDYERLLQAKALLTEQFMAENSTLNNSLRYFPRVTMTLAAHAYAQRPDDPLVPELNALLQKLLLYNLTADKELQPEIRQLLERLGQSRGSLPPEATSELESVLTHARVIFDQKSKVDAMVRELVSAPSIEQLDRLSHVYIEDAAQRERRADRFRFLIYLLCLGLVGGIAYTVLRLSRSVRLLGQRTVELTEINEALRQSQAQLVQSEKLAAMGQLAASLAHELKNPLGVVLQGMHYLQTAPEADQQAKRPEIFGLMKEGVARADKLVRKLLDLARPPALHVKPEVMREVLQTSLELVKRQLSLEHVTVVQEFQEDSVQVLIDREQMQQVLINLIVNAVQAMPSGGQLALRTTVKALTETGPGVGRRTEDYFRLGERALCCEIQDTGTGIPRDKLQKIFEPFFTTKPRGEGTGLGLAIVRSIVFAHRGLISVDSQEGRGTTFLLILPIVNA